MKVTADVDKLFLKFNLCIQKMSKRVNNLWTTSLVLRMSDITVVGSSNPDGWQLSYFTSTTSANKLIPQVEQLYEMSKVCGDSEYR